MYVQSYSAIKWAVTANVERASQSSLYVSSCLFEYVALSNSYSFLYEVSLVWTIILCVCHTTPTQNNLVCSHLSG